MGDPNPAGQEQSSGKVKVPLLLTAPITGTQKQSYDAFDIAHQPLPAVRLRVEDKLGHHWNTVEAEFWLVDKEGNAAKDDNISGKVIDDSLPGVILMSIAIKNTAPEGIWKVILRDQEKNKIFILKTEDNPAPNGKHIFIKFD